MCIVPISLRCARLLAIVLLSIFSFGFYVETPETIRENERAERKWQRELSVHYDFGKLRKFLAREIAAHREVDGIVLAQARMARKWKEAGMGRRCGDWFFGANSPDASEFTLSWTYESNEPKDGVMLVRSVTFHCVRKSKGDFFVVRVERSDNEMVILSF